ncbi:MAG TPA: organomercurial lyase [Methylomirabilota bacterium]|nr:organomercurial lyase [Methylomirabilota bacterium]
MNAFERRVRAAVYASLRDEAAAPSVARLAADLGAPREDVAAALQRLADRHCLVLVPGTESIWMAHPFSGIETDFRVTVGTRRWFANCVWDGLALLALLGDGVLATHSPATGEPLDFEARGGRVRGDGIVHFLVPARRFWDDIGHT